MELSKGLIEVKAAYWNAKTQAKFLEMFPRAKRNEGDTDAMFEHLVELCAYNVDEYTTLEDSVEGFLNN